MRHNYRIDGCAFALRPVALEDAELIVHLRTSDPHRTRFLHPIPPDVCAQRQWITQYLKRPSDYYWVVERLGTHQAEGLIGIYNLDIAQRAAEWGRWVLRQGSLAAVESAWLIYRTAFETLQLDSVYSITAVKNQSVVSFHDSSGLPRVALLPDFLHLGECSFDAVKHVCTKAHWPTVRNHIEPQVQLIAKRLSQSV